VRDIALLPDFDLKRAGKASKVPEKPPSVWSGLVDAAAAAAPGSAPETGKELVLQAVRSAVAAAPPPPATAPARCARLRSHLGMPRWQGAAGADPALEEANWEWLSDHDNAEKLRKVVDAWKADVENCATQLNALTTESASRLQSLKSFKQNLDASQVASVESQDVTMEPLHVFAKYGSKIEALVLHMQKLRRDDPTCKVICFVQWEDLKRKIGAALEEFGVEHLSLMGSVWARRSALTKFQHEESSPKILLLSLEESASGTNLTAANHVIIVHPMEAATREEAVAFELQAVGRVRRPGQQRKIHIWRFVTVDTIEQQITEEHQKELWERQRAKITISDPAPFGDDALHSDEGEECAADFDDGALGDEGVASTQRYLGGAQAPAAPPMGSKAFVEVEELETLPATEDLPQDGFFLPGAGGGDAIATQIY